MEGLLVAAAPLLLASLGALTTELAGSLGVFIEGFMVLGSFFSWTLAAATGSVLLGTLGAAAAAAAAAWGAARFVHKTGANPFIVGIGINLLAHGTTETLSTVWFGTKGVLADPRVGVPSPLVLADGALSLSPFVAAALLAVAAGALVVDRSAAGLRLRAAGAAPDTASERGIDPRRCREGAWAAAAALAAVAGAALSFRVGAYAPGGVAGRGWIALAAVYLGFRRVWGVAAAALLFAAAERLAAAAQGAAALPPTLLLGLPSAAALVLFSLSQGLKAGRKGRYS